ncbi:MAG: glycosyltransferase family 4 protein [Thermoproteota archaeon]|nr:glycosyltransferase family 4 protein [Thermoproteota archaeon]
MLAKIVHDDLNAGGGSERLAITTIELLNEMGYEVDIQTCTLPDINKIENNFGQLNIQIRKTKILDLLSLLLPKPKEYIEYGSDDRDYDLIINTHGDLLPYISRDGCQILYSDGIANSDPQIWKRTKIITYCHYPLVPYYVKNGVYKRFLNKFIKPGDGMSFESDDPKIEKLLSNARTLYDLTLNNTVILTNSEYSKSSIKQLYNKAEPIVLNPPVEINRFRRLLVSQKSEREDVILVVSRFSPDKQIENAIEVAKILHGRKIEFKMIIVGNVSKSDMDYLQLLSNMINDNDLNAYVKLDVGASFKRLLYLMSKSKVYLHPLAGEPFGISVAEAMAAGLVPVVPHVGGNSEFVPERYHYSKLEQASEIIRNVLFSSYSDDNTYNNNKRQNKMNITITSHIAKISEQKLRLNLSNLVLKFSADNFKINLKKIIIDALITQKDSTHIPLVNQRTKTQV